MEDENTFSLSIEEAEISIGTSFAGVNYTREFVHAKFDLKRGETFRDVYLVVGPLVDPPRPREFILYGEDDKGLTFLVNMPNELNDMFADYTMNEYKRDAYLKMAGVRSALPEDRPSMMYQPLSTDPYVTEAYKIWSKRYPTFHVLCLFSEADVPSLYTQGVFKMYVSKVIKNIRMECRD